MNKTVLLSDELHKQIKQYKIELNWVEIKMSIAKKIELFFDWYKADQVTETFESFKTNNRTVWDNIQDAQIRNDNNYVNPWLIK